MADNNQTQSQIHKETELSNSRKTNGTPKINRANQATGAMLLIVIFAAFWIYGFAGEIRNASTADYPTTGLAGKTNSRNVQTALGGIFVISTVFVVLGFGMLLGYLRRAAFTGIFTAIFTVSITFIISPILQKFWYNVFMSDFNGTAPDTALPPKGEERFWFYSFGGKDIYLDWVNLKIVSSNSIAQLLTYFVFIGKMNISQIILNTICFNVAWTLNLFLCSQLSTVSPDKRIFDDYQINAVYFFATVYAVVLSKCFLKKPRTEDTISYSASGHSTVISHLGAFFLFIGFSSTTLLFSLKYVGSTEYARSYIWQEAILASFFAMSSGAIFNYVFSILFGGKIGVRGSIGGSIVGAVMWGPVSGTCVNIGAAIAVGLIAGLFTAVDYSKQQVSENQQEIQISIGRISIGSAGTFIIAPIVIKTLYNYSVILPTFASSNSNPGSAITNKDAAGWVLVYVGITLGISLVGSIIIGLFLRCIERKKIRLFDDGELFKTAYYGLRIIEDNNDQGLPSAQNLVK